MYALSLQSKVKMCVFIMWSALWNDSVVWLLLTTTFSISVSYSPHALAPGGRYVCVHPVLFTNELKSTCCTGDKRQTVWGHSRDQSSACSVQHSGPWASLDKLESIPAAFR